ncbi:hypothetical protein L1887_17880 [Cichorium endivia]|nr:hypothetical protein L1887_17880 [Cichorium endivia]
MEGPIQQLKICTSLNIQVMEDFKEMISTPLPESLKTLIEDVISKLGSILDRLPVPPSVPAGAPGGGEADKLEIPQTDDMIIDTTAGPSGTTKENIDDTTKDQNQTQQEDTHADKGETQEDTHADEGETPSEDEILVFSPIKESDPPEVKEKKSKFFDTQALRHAENLSSESDPDKIDPSGLRRSPVRTIFSNPLIPRPLTDSDFKPFKTYNPPPSPQHNWDIPLTPNGDKYIYSLNFSQTPGFNKDLEAYHRNQKFLNTCTKPQVETWSIDPITSVRSLKLKHADFRMMNPADLFTIVRKLSTKEYQICREAYVTVKRFLHRLLEEFCTADAELFHLVNPTDPFREKVDLSMPEDRDNWKRGATFDPVLGLIYKNPKQKGSLFFLRAEQIRRLPNVNLTEYIKAIKKSQSSDSEAKKELILRVEWLLAIRKFWSYAVRQDKLCSDNLIIIRNPVMDFGTPNVEEQDDEWLIDSACSMHMTGRLEFLRDYREVNFGGYITFGNDANGIIKGYGLVSTGLRVEFDNEFSYIMTGTRDRCLVKSQKQLNMFPLYISMFLGKPRLCLLSKAHFKVSWLWHRKLAHLNFRYMNQLVTGEMVRGMPLLKFDNENLCAACALGKQKKKPHKTITDSSITHPLELLHIDLCGPSTVAIELKIQLPVRRIRSDNGTEFNNGQIEEFLALKGIEHNFAAPHTAQQNGLVERRNRTLVEAARSMLNFANLPLTFWAEAIAMLFEVDYDLLFDPPETATNAEVIHSPEAIQQITSGSGPSTSTEPISPDNQVRPPINISTFEGERSSPSQIHQVQEEPLLPTHAEEELILPTHVDGIPHSEGGHQQSGDAQSGDARSGDALINSSEDASNDAPVFTFEADEDTFAEESHFQDISPEDPNFIQDIPPPVSDPTLLPRLHKWTWNHPPNQIIGNPSNGVQTRSKKSIQDECQFAAYISKFEPKTVFDALDDDWIKTTEEELEEFKRNKVWDLMNVKSAFLQGDLQEVVYLQQTPGFEDLSCPNHVYRLNKAVYGLKQSSRAWYETLSNFLVSSGYPEGEPIDHKIYRGMIGSLLYLTASRPDIMFSTCLCARYQAAPKLSHLTAVKQIIQYLKGTKAMGMWYPVGDNFRLQEYTDSDHAGCKLDQKSISGGCQFLGGRLVSWSSKKQNCVALSSAEAAYVAASTCCSQVLWMKTQILDYGCIFLHVPIYCDSKSAMAISHNPIQYSMKKHIDLRYHFIKDQIVQGNIELYFIPTEEQVADVFTKALDSTKFNNFLDKLGMLNPDSDFFRE